MVDLKNRAIDLHMNWKRALCFVVFFSLIASALNVILAITTDKECAELTSLAQSKYEYSAYAIYPDKLNSFYRFNADISFMTSIDVKVSLSADTVMQDIAVEYTDQVSWSAPKLANNEVAVSKSLARKYKLNVGDKLYSKHIVNGEICEYHIATILPEATNVRVTNAKNYYKGVIIMGYDKTYIDNISSYEVIFTTKSVAELEANSLTNIVYREDEILSVLKDVLPYWIIFLLLSCMTMVGLAIFIYTKVKYNFVRLAWLGFDEKKLNRSYRSLNIKIGFAGIGISFIASIGIILFMRLCDTHIWFCTIELILEAITLLAVTEVIRKRLWRK